MQDEFVPYVLWGPQRCKFLGLRADGLSIPECLDQLDGITDRDIAEWLEDAQFASEHERMRADPMRFHRLIAVPRKLIKLDLLDLAYLDSKRAIQQGFSAKARELIMQEAGLLDPAPKDGAAWQAIMHAVSYEIVKQQQQLNATADDQTLPRKRKRQMIDVTPTEDERSCH